MSDETVQASETLREERFEIRNPWEGIGEIACLMPGASLENEKIECPTKPDRAP